MSTGSDLMESHSGGCHCGALAFTFRTATALAPRACGCGFCRKHGARSVSDPEGEAVIAWDEACPPVRYRFGTFVTDFLICPRCGIYVAALMEAEGCCLSVFNLNAFDDPRPDLAPEPMRYDGEAAGDRVARRRRVWTPTRLVTRTEGEGGS